MARKVKDDDDETVASAAAEIAEELAAGKGKRTTESSDGGDVEVDLDEEDDDDDDEPAAQVSPRNERRRDRYRANKEEAEREKSLRVAAEERERQATLRADAMALSFRQQGQPQAQVDPLDAEIEKAETEKKRLWDDMLALPAEAQLEPTRYAEFNKRADAAQRRIYELVSRREIRRHVPQQPQGQSEGRVYALANFPDVMAHPEGSKHVDALLEYRVRTGAPNTLQTLQACLTQVRADLRTGGPKRDVAALRSKLGHSSASRGSSGPAPQRRTVTLDANMRKLAKATYKGQGLTEEQMYKKFVRDGHMDDD